MNRNYYSDPTVDGFIRDTVCQKDDVLLRYFELEDVKRFRRRLEILKIDPKIIEKNIYAYVTDSIRDIILNSISELTVYMKPMGDLIISGGEAFNAYFSRDDKVVTSDIDTKFVPIFKLSSGKILSKNSRVFFENIQITKIILWDKLGKIARKIDERISDRIMALKMTRLGKLFGLKLPMKGPYVNRRYTLIKKKRQKLDTSNVTNGDVLIDVELMTLDLKIRYFSTRDSKIDLRNLGGILDIAFMRPGEVGYEVAESRDRGMYYYNMYKNRHVYDKNILVASKKFLLEDLYLMQSLGLRPDKKEKDMKRMYTFAKKVLKLKNITRKDGFQNIFNKSSKTFPKTKMIDNSDRPIFYKRKYLQLVSKINPFNYQNITTAPEQSKLISQMFIGLKGTRGMSINGFAQTSGKFRVSLKDKKWISNTRNSYIKNEYTYRPTKKYSDNFKLDFSKLKTSQVLYGYNPRRNRYMSRNVLYKSAFIPIIGLKNMDKL